MLCGAKIYDITTLFTKEQYDMICFTNCDSTENISTMGDAAQHNKRTTAHAPSKSHVCSVPGLSIRHISRLKTFTKC